MENENVEYEKPKRKSNNVWKVINIFAEVWSKEYNGEVYPRSARDLKSAKEFLELYPDFFEDEVLQMAFKKWAFNYLKDGFWYRQGNGKYVSMRHNFCYFIPNITKYTDAERKIEKKEPIKRRLMIECSSCKENFYADEYHECKEIKV